MICANPDIVVERGGRLVWCAGRLPSVIASSAVKTTMVGKPHAASTGGARRSPAMPASVLAIGDGIDTDVRGAVGQGIDVLFVTDGIHAPSLAIATRPTSPRCMHFWQSLASPHGR